MPEAMPMALAAVAAAGAGVGLLYLCWRRRPARAGWLVAAGWLLLAVSLLPWVRAAGAEFGTAYALLALTGAGWAGVLAAAELRRPRRQAAVAGGAEAAETGPGRGVRRHLLLFVLAVPAAAAAAAVATVGLSRLLPWTVVDRMALSALLMPVVWGCAAYWVTADPRPLRPVLGMVAAALVGGVAIVV
ncbi:hypothetical protein [Rhodocista pekingensis]|uniref:Uncharacterized protein n=1 Tax=Rhodocista pekingensis TaxID=201185 RepID=A0ABW2KYC4_9PROT